MDNIKNMWYDFPMEGYTITEMAEMLKINPESVSKRLQRKGIKPMCREVLYDKSDFEKIKNVKPKGWPKKQPAEKAKPDGKPKK